MFPLFLTVLKVILVPLLESLLRFVLLELLGFWGFMAAFASDRTRTREASGRRRNDQL